MLTPPIPSPLTTGSAKLLWVAILSALFVFSSLGAYVIRTHNSSAATATADPTPAATAPSPAAAPSDEPADPAKSEAIAAKVARQVWTDLKPVGQANLCKAYDKYPHDAIKGMFLQMAASDRATFTVEGATAVQVWNHLEHRLRASC